MAAFLTRSIACLTKPTATKSAAHAGPAFAAPARLRIARPVSLKASFSGSLTRSAPQARRALIVRAEDESVAVDDEEAPAAPAPEVVSKLYIGNLSWDTQPEDLRQAFEEYGSIIFCDVITDPNGRSRGFGFVEFEDAEQAAAAIDGTNGRDLDGREIRVDYVQARGARPERPPRTGGMKYNNNGHRIYIGNLPWKMDEYDLRDTFEEFGEVSDARVITDRETGRSRGFGFVTMTDEADMRNAIQGLDGAECDGRALRVNEAESR